MPKKPLTEEDQQRRAMTPRELIRLRPHDVDRQISRRGVYPSPKRNHDPDRERELLIRNDFDLYTWAQEQGVNEWD